VAGGCAVGAGAGCSARWPHAAWLASSGWVRDHGGWSSPSRTPGWATSEGPGEVPAGMGVRPQRGPSRQRALPARCRQRCDLRRLVVGLPGLEPGTSSLSGIFAGCVHAGRARHGQLSGPMTVTVVVRSIPRLTLRCGTRVARLPHVGGPNGAPTVRRHGSRIGRGPTVRPSLTGGDFGNCKRRCSSWFTIHQQLPSVLPGRQY
jgi:hypothetical protein